MREQKVKRIVDATKGQGRVMFHLSCGHNAAVYLVRNLETDELFYDDVRQALIDQAKTQGTFMCMDCPDPPPPEKSPTTLWREAGEP